MKEKTKFWIAAKGMGLIKDLRYELTQDAMDLYYEVVDHTSIRGNYDYLEEAFSCLLGNLYHAEIVDEPVIYSRSPNRYVIERERYGYEWYTHGRIVRLVDAMYELGLINGVKGRKVSNGQYKPSKMWATEDLSMLFQMMDGMVFIRRPVEVILLKDENKLLRQYRDNRLTRSMRRQLHELNEMLSSVELTFRFRYPELSDRAVARLNKLAKLRSLVSTNQVHLVPPTGILPTTHETDTYTTTYNTTIYYKPDDHDAFLQSKYNGFDFVGTVNSDANFMRRIFNMDWYHGGRFYHAPHITMPSACRKSLVIDGEPTVELDFSGMHIRMLYHLIGKDYSGECYVHPKSDVENKPDRERIKLASLIVINSGDKNGAIMAIHRECRKKIFSIRRANIFGIDAWSIVLSNTMRPLNSFSIQRKDGNYRIRIAKSWPVFFIV